MELNNISSEYRAYLNSHKWQAIRENILCRDEFKCRMCGSNDGLEVHHIRYANIFHEDKHPEDLMLLCSKCHSTITLYWKIADSIKQYYEDKRHEEAMRKGYY